MKAHNLLNCRLPYRIVDQAIPVGSRTWPGVFGFGAEGLITIGDVKLYIDIITKVLVQHVKARRQLVVVQRLAQT